MKEDEWIKEYNWLIEDLESIYGRENIKYASFDCGGQFGIAIKHKDGTRKAFRITDFNAYKIEAK